MTRFCIATMALGLVAGPALAVHNDVLIYSTGTKLQSGGIDLGADEEPGGGDDSFGSPTNVFEGELADLGGVWEGEEPGVNAISQANHNAFATGGFALPGSADLNFTLKSFEISGNSRNLWYWDGSGPVSFGAPGAGTQLSVFDVFPFATVDGSATDQMAIAPWETTGADGSLHQHRLYQLTGPGTLEGIYLVALEFSVAGVDSSDLVYLVFNAGLDEEDHEAAVEFVEALNGGPVESSIPEPSAVMLLGLVAIAAARRRTSRA